jgi:hypothetical protein
VEVVTFRSQYEETQEEVVDRCTNRPTEEVGSVFPTGDWFAQEFQEGADEDGVYRGSSRIRAQSKGRAETVKKRKKGKKMLPKVKRYLVALKRLKRFGPIDEREHTAIRRHHGV